MTDHCSSLDLTAPESIQEILTEMGPDQREALLEDFVDEYGLIHAETADGSVFTPASESPPPSAERAATICRDIAEIRATSER